MKHIYFFNTKSRAAVYGIGTYLRQVTDCMRSIPDVSFNIVNLLVDVPEFTREEKNGYISYDIPENYMQTTKIIDCYSRNIWFLLRPYIQLQKGDVLIFHLNYTNSNSWITWAKKDFPNCKILLTIHYQDWCFSLNGNTTYFRKQILSEKLASFSMEQKLYNDVDRIICLSHYTEKLLLHEYQIPREKIAVIYNGLKDEAVFLNREEKKKLKKKYFIREDEKIILFVGRLDDIKGVGYLIRAFRHVLDKIPESRLYIIGDGLYSKYLNDCSGYWNKVTFTGRLNKDELYEFYQIADIGVMPSLHEQCSYVAMEMLMFNIPLLISTSTGLNETLEGVEKIEVEEREDDVYISVEKMAESMLALLQAPPSNMYRETYLRKYEESLFLEKMRNLYESLFV